MSDRSVPHITGEIEFEIGGEGQLVFGQSTWDTIVAKLLRGDVEAAVTLYLGAPPGTDERLLREAPEYSPTFHEKLLEMFAQARDYSKAARCAQLVKDPEKAAQFLESAYLFAEAAALYEKGGSFERAGLLYERALDYPKAAETFLKCGNHGRALTNLQRIGRHLDAGLLCMKLKRWAAAVELLSKALESPETEIEAASLLGELMERGKKRREAAGFYRRIVDKRPPSAQSVGAYVRLSRILIDMEELSEAERVLGVALAALPGDASLAELRQRLDEARATNAVTAAPATPPPAPEPQEEPKKSETGVSAVDRVLLFLKGLPLFAHVTMDEVKALRDIAVPQKAPAGEVILSQGEDGKGLYVVLRGQVEVAVGAGEKARVVATLAVRDFFGEVSLVDDAPVSATVTALYDTVLLLIPKQDFRDYLFANERTAAAFYKTFAELLATRLRATNVLVQQAASHGGA